jgi:hypothetical protein
MHDKFDSNETILHENSVGCIVQCKHCNDILVKVKNILYSCDMKRFNSLYDVIGFININIEDHIVEILKERYVLINTPNENINLNFSLEDFTELVELFQQSKHMLEVNSILN